MLWNVVALLAAALQLWLVSRRANGFHPVMLIVALVVGITVLGADAYPALASYAAVSAVLPIDESSLIYGIQQGVLFSLALTVGALLISGRARKGQGATVAGSIRASPLLVLGLAPLLLALIGKGGAVWKAEDYGAAYGPAVATKLGIGLAPMAELALAVLFFRKGHERSNPAFKFAAFVGIVTWSMIHFGGASRQLALLPGIMLAGYLLSPSGGRVRRPTLLGSTLVLALTLWLSNLALELRGNPSGVGIAPLTRALLAEGSSAFEWRSVLGNVLFSSPLVAESARNPIAMHSFWVSVSPLPGGMHNWDDLSRSLRVNAYTPFSGLGELASQGVAIVLLFAAAVGLVLSLAVKIADGLHGSKRLVASAAIYGISTLFALNILQYNLRSATRLIYYLVVILLVLWLTARGESVREAKS